MLRLSNMILAPPLCSLPQHFFDQLAGRTTQFRVPDLLASDESAVDSLSESLTDETLLHSTGLDQIEYPSVHLPPSR